MLTDASLKKEASDYAAKNSWLNALVLAYDIASKALETASTLHSREPKNDKLKKAMS